MKKQKKSLRHIPREVKLFREWKERRDIALKAIPLEVDLENREVFIGQELRNKLDFDLQTSNVDRLISNFVHPGDNLRVHDWLQLAQQGKETPISFKFVHPQTAEIILFEYRYEIVYVRYACTRLNGVLVNITTPRIHRTQKLEK
jgi:hypothetical protein